MHPIGVGRTHRKTYSKAFSRRAGRTRRARSGQTEQGAPDRGRARRTWAGLSERSAHDRGWVGTAYPVGAGGDQGASGRSRTTAAQPISKAHAQTDLHMKAEAPAPYGYRDLRKDRCYALRERSRVAEPAINSEPPHERLCPLLLLERLPAVGLLAHAVEAHDVHRLGVVHQAGRLLPEEDELGRAHALDQR